MEFLISFYIQYFKVFLFYIKDTKNIIRKIIVEKKDKIKCLQQLSHQNFLCSIFERATEEGYAIFLTCSLVSTRHRKT